MLRIDFYVQHLVRHNATGIELRSGNPVKFAFPTGERTSNATVDHGQVTRLVQEVASKEVIERLRSSGEATFVHESEAGVAVEVKVCTAEGQWTVALRPVSTPSAGTSEAAQSLAAEIERPLGGAMASAVSTSGPVTGDMSAARGRATPDAPVAPRAATAPGLGGGSSGLGGDDSRRGGGYGAHGGGDGKSAAEPPQQANSHAQAEPKRPASVVLAAGEPEINRWLRMLVLEGGSDLHLSSEVKPMARIHGSMQVLDDRPVMNADELGNFLREILPERNAEEFANTNDTDFAHTIEKVARFRANYFVDRHGVGAVFRQIPFEILSVDQIGLPKRILDLCWLSKGLVLVTGPTGSGKSTTLATLVDYINDNRDDHIITIEDPIEFVHQNKKCLVNQREVGTHTQSFKRALRAALREDPDIVLVGEMRDLETISIAIETAETGHLVFGTLHTTTAISTVDRIIDQFPPDQQEQIRVMLSESLRGVIAQVLCRKKGGGRVAAYEVLISTPAVANLIREGKTFQLRSVMQTGKSLGMQTMNDNLLALVRDGVVTPEEAYIKASDKLSLKDQLKHIGIELAMNE